MKKQKTQMLILILIIVILAVCYIGVRHYNSSKEEQEAAEEEANTVKVTDMEVSDVTAFSYTVEGTTYSYTKDGDSWLWDGDTAMDLEESQVETLLANACGITADEEITDYDELSDYGLADPAAEVTVTTADKTVGIAVGDKNAITGNYYVKCDDSDSVYLIDTNLATTFNVLPEDMKVEEETETEEPEETESVSETEAVDATENVVETEE